MVEEVKIDIDSKEEVTTAVKGILKQDANKYINMYYRAEGTFVFSLMALLFCIFMWDDISDPLFFFTFTVILNILLMMYFLFKHLKQKEVL